MKLQYWPHGFLSPDYGTGSVLRTFTKTKDSIVLSATWFYGALSVELGLCFFASAMLLRDGEGLR